MWSDESYNNLSDTKGFLYITRCPGEETLQDNIVPTVKQLPIRIMVWGCIGWDYKSDLIVLEYESGKGNVMNADRFVRHV